MKRGLSAIAVVTVVALAATLQVLRTKGTHRLEPGGLALAAGKRLPPGQAPKLVRNDLRLAAEAALALADGPARLSALRRAVDAMADWDVEVALRWTRANVPAGPLQQAALLAVCAHLAGSEPDLAIELAETLPPSDSRDRVIGASASLWARKDPAAALDWLRQLPAEELKPGLVANIGLELAATDLPAAAELTEMLPAGDAQTVLLNSVARSWTAQDPGAAAAWISTWPEGLARETAISQLASQWARLDADAAGLWLNSLPAGSSRDRAIWVYAETLAPTQPALALSWAGQINDHDRRAAAMASAARWAHSPAL